MSLPYRNWGFRHRRRGSGLTPHALISSPWISGLMDGGEIMLYAAPQPASTEDEPSGALLGTIGMAVPVAPLGNLITPTSIRLNLTGGTVYVGGTIAFAVARSADDSLRYFLTVGTTGSGANLTRASLAVVTGEQIDITSASVAVNAAYV